MEAVRRRCVGLSPAEWYFVLLGASAVGAAGWLASSSAAPPIGPLVLFCVLNAAAVHFHADADDSASVGASAQGVVVAAAVFVFRSSSPLLAPLLVGMSAACWRLPRSRRHWFTAVANLGADGFPALAAAAALHALPPALVPSAVGLAVACVPVALAYTVVNSSIMTVGLALQQRVRLREASQVVAGASVLSGFVPFVFGGFVGVLAGRFGLVPVVGLASVCLVMVQAVFVSLRRAVESERAVLAGLVNAVEAKDPYTAGHSLRVQRYARLMGSRLGFRGRRLARLEQFALMHDIGKLAVPNHVLRKPGKLDADEVELMRRHESCGAAIMERVPFLAQGAGIVSGAGKRDGLDGAVSAAHVVHAADAFDAMTSTRSYRKARSQAEAHVEMCTKTGQDFHGDCVEALFGELDARGEVHGAGSDDPEILFEVEPPERELGETLDDQFAHQSRPVEAAAGIHAEPPTSVSAGGTRVSRRFSWSGKRRGRLAAAGCMLAAAAAVTGAAWLVPATFVVFVGLGELVGLRPVHGHARRLSLIASLTALAGLPLATAAVVIGTGVLSGEALDTPGPWTDRGLRLARRLGVAAATVGVFARMSALVSASGTAARLIVLLAASLAGLVTRRVVVGELRTTPAGWLADCSLLATAPLVALGTGGTAHTAGFGLGAAGAMLVPILLLVQGYERTRAAHENLHAWVRAVAVAPEHAGLVVPGHAQRVAGYADAIAAKAGLDAETRELLAAAAWMERVGECCLDESYVTGEPHRRDEIIDASAAMLKASEQFYPAGQILWASSQEPELATDTPIDIAGQILRVAIAFEDATHGRIERDEIPQLIAVLRTSTHHPIVNAFANALQAIVAPGTTRSTWEPVRTHALLTCGCAAAVDDYTIPGDPHPCTTHGEQSVDVLAASLARDNAADPIDLFAATARLLHASTDYHVARGVQRELIVRVFGHDLQAAAPVAAAGYQLGRCWENNIAEWARETGASPHDTGTLLCAAGTTGADAYQAIRDTYTDTELALRHHPVTRQLV
ncbi:MAG: HD domain-containing protein [Acidimicrobiia bacterium]